MTKKAQHTDPDRARQEFRRALEEIAEAAGPEVFRELARGIVLGLGSQVRRELAEGKITEDHTGYRAVLEAERAKRKEEET